MLKLGMILLGVGILLHSRKVKAAEEGKESDLDLDSEAPPPPPGSPNPQNPSSMGDEWVSGGWDPSMYVHKVFPHETGWMGWISRDIRQQVRILKNVAESPYGPMGAHRNLYKKIKKLFR